MITSNAGNRARAGILIGGLFTLVATLIVALAPTASSAPLPLCGGNQTVHAAPLTCAKTRVIDGTAFTVVLAVSAGGVATATYTVDAPRPADTPVSIRWNEGISSGPSAPSAAGVIIAGSTGPEVLMVTGPGCGGQIDTKAVFTASGDTRGRVTAPFVSIPSCSTPTTTAPSSTSTTIASTTTVATTGTAAPTTTPAAVLAESVTAPAAALPVTGGSGRGPAAAGAMALLLGTGLVLATRRRRVNVR